MSGMWHEVGQCLLTCLAKDLNPGKVHHENGYTLQQGFCNSGLVGKSCALTKYGQLLEAAIKSCELSAISIRH